MGAAEAGGLLVTPIPIPPKRKTIINHKISQLYYNIINNNKRKLNNKKIKNKGSFPLQNNTQSPIPIPIYNRGDVVNLSDLLFSPDRDFLITYKDRNRPVLYPTYYSFFFLILVQHDYILFSSSNFYTNSC